MKKIIAILVSLIMVVAVFTACTNGATGYEVPDENEMTQEQTTVEQEENYELETTGYYVEETTTQTYYHSALEGCVIVEQDGSEHVVYQEKCEACGTLQSGTRSVYHSFGTLNSSFHCYNCGNTQSVQLHSEMQ